MALLLLAIPGTARAQLSPGPLSRPHAGLEGSTNCLQCHDPDEGVSPSLCLDCHGRLAARVDAGRGLHARADHADCAHCHPEHAGVDFDLVYWGERGREAFDHAQAGWALDGGHARVDCASCHRRELVRDPEVLAAEDVSAERTFLGLSPDCASCHFDEHRGQLGAGACDRCHVTAAWTPAPGFDHATSFPLRGAHAAVECTACHPRQPVPPADTASGVPVLAPRLDVVVRYAVSTDCAACHADPHRGGFRPAGCADCHSESAWAPAPGFDHARTRYPLTGRHRGVACTDCHGSGDAVRYRELPFAACSDCHDDPHKARLGAGCAQCHTTSGWNLGEETFDHARTRYPLAGRHRQVACEACHPAGRPLTGLQFDRCASCHADIHVGQLDDRPGGSACEDCHDVEGFRPARYDLARHEQSRYPLEGAHRAVACVDCHRPAPARDVAAPGFDVAAALRAVGHAGSGEEVTTPRLRFASFDCASCHADPHTGSVGTPDGGCAVCHTVDGWRTAAFDHGSTHFPLAGRHAAVDCLACHIEVGERAPWPLAAPRSESRRPRAQRPADAPAPKLVYTGTPSSCDTCHADVHADQFADLGPGSCSSCHGPTAWAPSTFDHATTSFPLDGAHARTPCSGCHLPGPSGVVRYRDVPTSCEGCHQEVGP